MRRIQIDYKPESSSAASSSAALTPTQFLNQNPIFKKASGEFIAKKFRLEFERRTSIRPECKRRAQLLQNVASRKSTIINTHSAKRPRKRRMPILAICFVIHSMQFCFHFSVRISIVHPNEKRTRGISKVFGSIDNGK